MTSREESGPGPARRIDGAVTQHVITELYQGEVLGEGLFNRMLADLVDGRQRHLVASMLQLETETKARLRQAAAEHNLPLMEEASQRAAGEAVGASLAGMTWLEKMRRLEAGIGGVYLPRYQDIADAAEPGDEEITSHMVAHETTLLDAVRGELAGRVTDALDAIASQLRFPLPHTHDG